MFLVGLAFGLVGLVQIAAGFVVLSRRNPVGFASRFAIGFAVSALGLGAAVVALGTQGYRTLAREEVAAHIAVRPSGPQRFDAQVRYPDGRVDGFVLAGDELSVEARILNWSAAASAVGLEPAYDLHRIAGRYRSAEQERTALRTVYPLGAPHALDIAELRRRHAWLGALFDAERVTASFAQVTRPAELELRISLAGVSLREAKAKD